MKYAKILLFVLFVSLSFNLKVNAERFFVGSKISNVYYKKVAQSGKGHYALAAILQRNSDGRHVYCLDPFIKFGENQEYNASLSSNGSLLGYSYDTWKKLSAIAYFGYGYIGHEDILWYAITQVAIWRVVDPTTDSYFTSSLNGSRTSIYDDKLSELNNLVNNYLNLNISMSYSLDYSRPYNLTERIENEIPITSGLINNGNYIAVNDTFKGNKTYISQIGEVNNATLYTLSGYQSLVEVHNLPLTQRTFNLANQKGMLNINLVIENDTYSSCQSNAKNKFQLLDENKALLKEFTMESNNYTINDLEYGKYYVKQVESTCDVYKNTDEYLVEINKPTNNLDFVVKKRLTHVTITKQYCVGKTCKAESNAVFEIKSDSNYSKKITTDDKGKSTISLGVGTYVFHQVSGKKSYTYVSDFTITAKGKVNDYTSRTLYDWAYTYNIVVDVIDNFNNPIKDSKVCLYDESNQIVECGVSDEKGKIKFNTIEVGSYYIKQENVDERYKIKTSTSNINLNSSKNIKIINQLIKEIPTNKEKSDEESIDEVKTTPLVNEIINDRKDEELKESDIQDNVTSNKSNYIYDTYINELDYITLIIIGLFGIILIIKINEKYNN